MDYHYGSNTSKCTRCLSQKILKSSGISLRKERNRALSQHAKLNFIPKLLGREVLNSTLNLRGLN